VVDLVDAHGREAYRGVDLVPEYLGSSVTLVGVDKHAWNDAMAVESLPVCRVRMRLTGIGGCIEPAIFGEFCFG
jgi:hypothetical protein